MKSEVNLTEGSIAKNIINAREGNVKVHSGGGGVYGKICTPTHT